MNLPHLNLRINIPIEDLRAMRAAGGACIQVEAVNQETGEKTETRIDITLEQIDRIIQVYEASQRASRN
jgi:hypothetical protein